MIMKNNNSELDNYLSLKEASILSGLSQVHLRYLASNRKLWGKKIGRNWVTSKQAIYDYLERQKKPGRPPKKDL